MAIARMPDAFYDLAAGGYEWVETPEADVEEVTLSGDGRILAWLVNVDGWEQLKLRDLESGEELPDPELPAGARPHLTGFRPPIAAVTRSLTPTSASPYLWMSL